MNFIDLTFIGIVLHKLDISSLHEWIMIHLIIMANRFEIEDHSRPLKYAVKLAKLSVSKITSLSSQLVYLRK